MSELMVTRLLLDPMGAEAPDGEPGQVVQVSDGRANVYLEPDEFEELDQGIIMAMLSRAIPRPGGDTTAPAADRRDVQWPCG
jgi:hypothetical protein